MERWGKVNRSKARKFQRTSPVLVYNNNDALKDRIFSPPCFFSNTSRWKNRKKKQKQASHTEMVKDLCQEGIKANPRSSASDLIDLPIFKSPNAHPDPRLSAPPVSGCRMLSAHYPALLTQRSSGSKRKRSHLNVRPPRFTQHQFHSYRVHGCPIKNSFNLSCCSQHGASSLAVV